MSEQSDWIVETTDESFETDVMVRSQLGLVVVDFWAEWCAPCRMLAPILEKIATESNGQFTLVKAEVEKNQEAAGQFDVAGIPAVFAVLDEKILDRFEGGLPEAAIKDWLANLETEVELLEAISLGDQDPSAAETKLREILAVKPEHVAVAIALAQLLLQQQRMSECRELLESLESRGYLEPEAEQLKAELILREKSTIDVSAAQSEAEAQPDDFDAQLNLAEALVGQEEYEKAFEICLLLVERDRSDTGERARALMVDVFKALPADSEMVSEYRRKLSMLLF